MPATQHIPERWLHWSFEDCIGIRQPFTTTEGQPITIIQAGYRNPDNGPDFRNALLDIGGVRCRGDVEIHVTPAQWFQHGHDGDTRYQHVILHVLWDAPGGVPATLAARFPHVCLKSNLNISESQWLNDMQQRDQHPETGQTTTVPGPEVLVQAAEKRFRRKVDRFREWCRYFSFDAAFFIALAEALGYSKNKFPFRQLLWDFPPGRIRREIPARYFTPRGIWLYLAIRAGWIRLDRLGAGGSFFPDDGHARQMIEHYFQSGCHPVFSLHDWSFSRLRPFNSPFIRMAALAQLLYHFRREGLFTAMLDIAGRRMALSQTIHHWQRRLALPMDQDLQKLLQTQYRFNKLPGKILGQMRIRQFIINGVLPALSYWAQCRGNFGFRIYLDGLYENFPGSETATALKRQLHNCAGTELESLLKHRAFFQQGLLEYMTLMINPESSPQRHRDTGKISL